MLNKQKYFKELLKYLTENTNVGITKFWLGCDNGANLWPFDNEKYQASKHDRLNDENKRGCFIVISLNAKTRTKV